MDSQPWCAETDGCCFFIVEDEALDPCILESLLRLGLPRQDTILGDALVEDMISLLLAEGHKEHPIIRPLRDGYDALKTPCPRLSGMGRGAGGSWR